MIRKRHRDGLRGTWVAALILTCCACAPDGPALPDPPDTSIAGLEPLVARRVEEATRNVREHAASAEAWGRLGEVYDVHRLPLRAVACYDTAASLDTQAWRWPYLAGVVLRESDREASLQRLERAAERNPDYAPLQFYLGQAYLAGDDLDTAERHWSRAAELDPRMANARLGLARVALARGAPRAALEQLEQAERLAPRDAAVQRHLAQTWRALGEAERSRQARAAAERMGTGGFRGMAALDDPLREEIVERHGASTARIQARVQRWLERGEPARALGAVGEALAVDPDSAVLLLESARVLAALERTDEARRRIERVLALEPDNAMAHGELGALLARAGRGAEAIAAYDRALALDPDLADAQNNLAALLLDTGRPQRALELLRSAAASLPDRAEVQYNLASLLLAAGRLDEAADVLTRAIERVPQDAGLHALLGEIRGLQRRPADAVRSLRDALRLDAADAGSTLKLAWILATSPDNSVRDGASAEGLARRVAESTGSGDPSVLDVLAAAQAEAGRHAAAVRNASRALELVEGALAAGYAADDPSRRRLMENFAGELRDRLRLYRAGAAYRDRR